MIGDPAGASQQFQDQDVQDVLDTTRLVVRYAMLRAEPTLSQGGIIAWNDFYGETVDWEDAPATQLYGPAFQLLNPATADTLTGHWQFTLPSPGQPIPVFVTGVCYDRYAAAADLCERWAATLARNYDFSTGAQKFSRSQAPAGMLQMAAKYRSLAKARIVALVRDDTAVNGDWPVNIYGTLDNW